MENKIVIDEATIEIINMLGRFYRSGLKKEGVIEAIIALEIEDNEAEIEKHRDYLDTMWEAMLQIDDMYDCSEEIL